MAPRFLFALALSAMLSAALPAHAMDVVDLTPPVSDDDGTRTFPTETEPTPKLPTVAHTSDSGGSSEDYEPPTLQTRHFGFQVELSCRISSDGELELVNESAEPLPPGTRIKWQFRQERVAGFFAITGPLGAGRRMVANGILGDRAPGGQCTARVI